MIGEKISGDLSGLREEGAHRSLVVRGCGGGDGDKVERADDG
ncbi:hypothetical protein ACWEJ6_53965 [Nonomuraea sp. NPDC004702]